MPPGTSAWPDACCAKSTCEFRSGSEHQEQALFQTRTLDLPLGGDQLLFGFGNDAALYRDFTTLGY